MDTKMKRARKTLLGSNRQLHIGISKIIGCHYKAVKQWQDKGNMDYRMFRYLHNKFYLNGNQQPVNEEQS